ncbi:hypothetical protein Fcan01_14737 [Folsomia candida]|uniref:Uncharacterized protein n=1 Tax=Folsomia candida TaxID=158441 RepID=A0A226DXS3_FOLCA|nr:hypothetical protein Fcan01_14737 [Folsomia candida]
MAPLSSNSAGYDEVLEIQHHLVHLNSDHHHKTLVESINSLLHVGASANDQTLKLYGSQSELRLGRVVARTELKHFGGPTETSWSSSGVNPLALDITKELPR